ncbi:genetic suppressor element 1-like isoform X2 [Stigmatopora argus]
MFGLKSPHFYLAGMSHESTKSASLGMVSTATVSPLSPLTNGSALAGQSANSGFAAALRKLAKQAEDPRGLALSAESSPVSSPVTSRGSPVGTPKRASLGPVPAPAQTRGHAPVPAAPPVVAIAPSKNSNGSWRVDGRQVEQSVPRLGGRPPQDKRTPAVPPLPHPFGLAPSPLMQDPRMQNLSLPGQMLPSGSIPEDYLRALRPFATPDDLRLTSAPLGLDPSVAAAYYHPAFLHHPLSLPRMEESLCLSALRSQFYSLPGGGAAAFPPLHPSGLHLHLPGAHYPGELNHGALAERLQMENEFRQREREEEMDRQKERLRERQRQMVRAAEGRAYLAEGPPGRPEDERLDKAKEPEPLAFSTHKPLPLSLHPSRVSVPHPMPSLVPSHLGKLHATTPVHGANPRAGEEAWIKDNRLAPPKQGFLESAPPLGAPPPLISPKAPTPALWNPASLAERRKPAPPTRPPPGLTRSDRPHPEGAGRPPGSTERRSPAGEEELLRRRRADAPRPRFDVPLSDPGAGGERRKPPAAVYDEVLRQHRRLLSKLDLEEKRRREARQGGYYYDLNDSYDESDEEEVRAHLRRVTEQPPLKLNTSSEKVAFLGTCGLVTLAQRDQLLQRKRRKRRRMMRERSTSPSPPPPATRGQRKSPPSLRTPYTAEQMDGTPGLQEKKDFLRAFKLSHVSARQRKDKEKTEDLLKAIEKKTVTLDTIRYGAVPPCRNGSPTAAAASSSESRSSPPSCQSNGNPSPSPSPPCLRKATHNSDCLRPPPPPPPPPLASRRDKAPDKKPPGVHNGHLKKEPGGVGVRSWERFTPEAFAQHFHQAVLQSTHHKASNSSKTESAPPRDFSPLKTSGANVTAQLVNGYRPRHRATEEDADDEEDEEEEDEEPPRKWKGIEAIFQAYHDYVDERSVERQVLHSQCKRLEAQNIHLSRTAEQLSLTMTELVSQKQRVREERERLHAQLEHFRRCLTLPSMHWGRGGHGNR